MADSIAWAGKELGFQIRNGEDEYFISDSGGGDFVAVLSDVADLRIGDLHAAMREVHKTAIDTTATIIDGDADALASFIVDALPTKKMRVFDEVWFHIMCNGDLWLFMSVPTPSFASDKIWNAILVPIAERNGLRLVQVKEVDDVGGWRCRIFLDATNPDMTIGDAMRLRSTIAYVVHIRLYSEPSVNRPASLDWETARDLVLSGHPDYLIGHAESSWLDSEPRSHHLRSP
ncbi:hypothetical protein [Catellatospora sp. TT07R-123]|uniref:hypothetical protein n=1 Tax=Catellatospora sp. TT07R-123 TaxID=2733863 RepID=UPI001BB45412|nr:hypothetical protein [Catellatospora sp. TT07R-123]